MLMFLIFFMIFVGVTTALYQVYETHYSINAGNQKRLSDTDKNYLKELSEKAKVTTQPSVYSDFGQMIDNIFGPQFDRKVALKAFTEKEESTYVIPLLRRKARLSYNGNVKVRHLPFWRTRLPSVDVRGMLITLVIVNCFLIQLLGAMSIYTVHYEVSMPLLVWLNDPLIVMLSIYALILLTYVISRLDMYMHDIYQLGRLFLNKTVDESDQSRECM